MISRFIRCFHSDKCNLDLHSLYSFVLLSIVSPYEVFLRVIYEAHLNQFSIYLKVDELTHLLFLKDVIPGSPFSSVVSIPIKFSTKEIRTKQELLY